MKTKEEEVYETGLKIIEKGLAGEAISPQSLNTAIQLFTYIFTDMYLKRVQGFFVNMEDSDKVN